MKGWLDRRPAFLGEWGVTQPLLLRRERLDLGLGLRLLYASDLHLRPRQGSALVTELTLAAEKVRPHAVLLGGDLVDSLSALPFLKRLVEELAAGTVVGAVSGNHDVLVGLTTIRDCVVGAGGVWLEEQALQLPGLTIAGTLDLAPSTGPWVFCGHYPTRFPQARRAGARLVLAGHLHGWQLVLGQHGEYLFPGAFLSRWNGLRFERQGSTLLVSRGMTDLFPLRWNCPREVLDVRL